jgi:hypothetical protein
VLWVHCTELEVEQIFHRRTVLFRMPSGSGAGPERPGAGPERPGAEPSDACAVLDDYLSDYPRDADGLAIE